MKENKIAFTIDVEDGISITMRDAYGKIMPPTQRVEVNTYKILDLLDQKDVKGTFFILGIVAEYFPKLIKEISERGHEIGVHGYHHYEFSRMNEKLAFKELKSAKSLLEDLSGQAVLGHRAPAFSINENTAWGLEVVGEVGFVYDSSIMPIHSKRYGWPEFKKNLNSITTFQGDSFFEIPLTTAKILGIEIPAIGGRYFQMLPYQVSKYLLHQVFASRPAIFYMHPYEIDVLPYPDFYYAELNKSSFSNRLKTYIKWINRSSFYPKLSKLLSEYNFVPIINLI